MIEQINSLADVWLGWMAPMAVQVAVLIVVVAVVDVLFRRWAWPGLRYALWLLVLVKLIWI